MSDNTPDILKKILARKLEEIAEREARENIDALNKRIETASPVRGFISSIEKKSHRVKRALLRKLKKLHRVKACYVKTLILLK